MIVRADMVWSVSSDLDPDDVDEDMKGTSGDRARKDGVRIWCSMYVSAEDVNLKSLWVMDEEGSTLIHACTMPAGTTPIATCLSSSGIQAKARCAKLRRARSLFNCNRTEGEERKSWKFHCKNSTDKEICSTAMECHLIQLRRP